MNKNIEPIERYLRGLTPPRCVSETHRRELRQRVLEQWPRPRTIPVRNLSWKIAVAALVCLAGVVGALLEARHHAAGPNAGAYQLIRQEQASAAAGKDLEGIESLTAQNNLKLISVIESEVNGQLDSRTLLCKYAMPDGQAKTAGDPNRAQENPLASLPAATWTEISQLRQAGQAENLGTQVKEIKGRPFVFQRERFTLHNGTKVIVSVGAPREATPASPPATGAENQK